MGIILKDGHIAANDHMEWDFKKIIHYVGHANGAIHA